MVTDTVYLATEDIVWEALWDQARKLKKRQMEDLEREMGRKKQVDRVMQEEWEILLILLVSFIALLGIKLWHHCTLVHY